MRRASGDAAVISGERQEVGQMEEDSRRVRPRPVSAGGTARVSVMDPGTGAVQALGKSPQKSQLLAPSGWEFLFLFG